MSETLLTFVHISDTHLSHDPNYQPYDFPFAVRRGAEGLVRQLQNLPVSPDFVLHTGDVAYDPDPRAYAAAREVLGGIPYRMIYLAGNHDDPAALQQTLLGANPVKTPFDQEFEINGVQIIAVDSSGPVEQPAGIVRAEQLEWLEGRCAAHDERPLVVAVHHNPLPVGVPWLDDYMRMVNGEDFHRALLPARARLRGVFFGHVHQNITFYRDGILYSSVLSSWVQFHSWPGQVDTLVDENAEPGFNLVTLTRDQTYIRRCRYAVT
ncbi:MAG: 3',5'-cyclic adenosine monophosphate phosphodiesterase CpdA [Chloroflexota bacterium]|nr:MAG: 3',5'-cyclic adenosine monophosphate phosphodiesterase CpdA [Chloroflexota bacterium]